jgi:DNA-directed RNA polymerase subunit RPC12/RpoP
MSLLDLFRDRCPDCGKRKLQMRQLLKQTHADEAGRRFPGSTSFVSCAGCGARFKNENNGPYVAVSDDEWVEHVGLELPPR